MKHWRRWLILVLVLSAVAGWGYRAYVERLVAAERLAQLYEEERPFRALQKNVLMQFGREVTVREWLDEFTRQCGLPVVLHPRVRYRTGTYGGRIIWEFKDETRVMFDIPAMQAREALDTLAQPHEQTWRLRNDGTIVFNDFQVEEPVVTRSVALPIQVGSEDRDELRQLYLWYELLKGRDSIDDNMPLTTTPSGYVVVQSWREQLPTELVLNQLAVGMQSAHDMAMADGDERIAASERTWLGVDPAAMAALEAALERPITLSARYMPWGDFAAELSRLAQFPIVIDPEFHEETPKPEANVTCRVEKVPLREVLDYVASPQRLALYPTASGRLLILGTYRQSLADKYFLSAAYPVSDLTADHMGRSDATSLGWALTNGTESNSWSQYNGAADSVRFFLDDELMFVSQRLSVHQDISRLLAALRVVRQGHSQRVSLLVDSPALAPMEEAELKIPVSLHYGGATIQEIVQEQRDRFGVNISIVPANEPNRSDNRVWCHLPEAPLEKNLRRLFENCNYQFQKLGDRFRIVSRASGPERDRFSRSYGTCELFDLRPWLLRGTGDAGDICKLLSRLVPTDDELASCNPIVVGETLVVRCEGRMSEDVQDVLAALQEYVASSTLRHWRGQLLTGEARNEPLRVWVGRPITQSQDIAEKVANVDSVDFLSIQLGDAILTLASKHDLPIVVCNPPAYCPSLRSQVALQLEDATLGEILQQLIGDPSDVEWTEHEGCLRIASPQRERRLHTGYWYSVDDLLRPRGPYQQQELLQVLRKMAIKPDESAPQAADPFGDPFAPGELIQLHYGNLLWVAGEGVDQAALEAELRKSRSSLIHNSQSARN